MSFGRKSNWIPLDSLWTLALVQPGMVSLCAQIMCARLRWLFTIKATAVPGPSSELWPQMHLFAFSAPTSLRLFIFHICVQLQMSSMYDDASTFIYKDRKIGGMANNIFLRYPKNSNIVRTLSSRCNRVSFEMFLSTLQ